MKTFCILKTATFFLIPALSIDKEKTGLEALAKNGYFEPFSRVAELGEKDFSAMDDSQFGQAHGRWVFTIVEAAIQCGVSKRYGK